MAIRSYKGKFAETIHAERRIPKGFPADLANVARRKLIAVNAAVDVSDLKAPPGNRLEQLQGNLKGKWSIRINDQWRIVFRWSAKDDGPHEVEITDYH